MRPLHLPAAAPAAVAVAATMLAVTSRGDAVVLGVVLVVAVARPVTAVGVAGALVASSWRWGSASLEALAGAQAVLGPAGGVGPEWAAAGSWLAAAALLLVLARRGDPWVAAATGAVVAAVLAGPAPGGDLPVRVAVGVGVAASAAGLGRLRADRPRLDRALAVLGAGAGIAAVAAVAQEAPRWPPGLEGRLTTEGAAVAVATIALVLVADRVLAGARWRGRGVPPIVMRPRIGLAPVQRRPR